MKVFRKLMILPLAVLAIQAADRKTETVADLLSSVKVSAYQLRQDAATLETYSRSGSLSWQSHATVINQMKESINAAGIDLAKLSAAKETASPWQRVAIERIEPLLRELASNTEKAINHINEKPSRLFMEPYKAYIEANADTSAELASMISDFIDYGNTKDRLDALESKLELPSRP